MIKNPFTKLQEFIKSSMPSVSKFIIYDTEDGRYIMFERYAISKYDNQVMVTRYSDEHMFKFNKLRHAVAWAVLDKNKRYWEATRLIELDIRLTALEVDIEQHKRIKNNTPDMNRYSIMLDKIQHDVALQTKFQKEIDKYIIMANDCQLKGFENELTRSSGK